MTQPLSRCGVTGNPCVLDRFFCYFLGLITSTDPLLPRIGEGNRLHLTGAPTSPPFVVCVSNSLQGCQPCVHVVRWVLVVVRQTSFFAMLLKIKIKCFT